MNENKPSRSIALVAPGFVDFPLPTDLPDKYIVQKVEIADASNLVIYYQLSSTMEEFAMEISKTKVLGMPVSSAEDHVDAMIIENERTVPDLDLKPEAGAGQNSDKMLALGEESNQPYDSLPASKEETNQSSASLPAALTESDNINNEREPGHLNYYDNYIDQNIIHDHEQYKITLSGNMPKEKLQQIAAEMRVLD